MHLRYPLQTIAAKTMHRAITKESRSPFYAFPVLLYTLTSAALGFQ